MYPVANIGGSCLAAARVASIFVHGGLTLTSYKTLRSRRANDVNSASLWLAIPAYVARLDSHTQYSLIGPMLL